MMASSLRSHRPGRAALVVIAVLALVALTAGALILARARGTASAPAAPEAIAADPAQEERDIDELQKALDSAIEQRQDPRKLAPQAEALIKRYPKSFQARVTGGMVLMAAGRGDRAYSEFVEALKINAADAAVQSLAGSLASQMGKLTEAQKHFSQAVGLEPGNPRHRLHLAATAARDNRDDEARSGFLEALRLDSSLHQARYGLAELYAKQNKINLALDQIAMAVELAGTEDESARETYLRRQAGYLRRDNRPDEALAILRALPATSRITPEVSEELATTWMMLGKPASAAEHYEAILAVNVTAEWAAEAAARYYLKAGDKARATASVEKLRRINPRSPVIAELEKSIAS